jgi:acetyl-CoA carboxylase biotin carboxylase subunit
VPVVPGTGILEDLDAAVLAAKQIGYPVLLKASAGGGGRGQKVIRTQDELKKGFDQAREEARLYFSDPALIMEKFLEEFRHVEVQVMGDGTGHVIHIGERDCSIQRRNQKLIEEAPSTLPDSLRQEILAAGVRLAQHVNYAGAGTLEFIVDRDGNYYFMEMNTRIQVEHCVSEMISGLDLVRMQLEIASGHGLNLKQEDVVLRGHAIECRLNAEDPSKDFRPAAGRIDDVHFAGGPGVRVDSHAYTGYVIPPHYDSLIGKLIVWHDNRAEAIARMKRALEETVIQGPKTTIPLYIKIMDNPFYKRGAVMTNFLKTRMDL